MIPYFKIPVYELGPIPIDPWGTLVCVGFVLGLEMARARGVRAGLSPANVVDGLVATVLTGFVVGHLVHVLAYNQHLLEEEGVMALLRIWAGFSSFGGFVGAVLGSVLFYRARRLPYLVHADVIMYGFPFGWFFGRLGCFSVHDHIGALTSFPLAVAFPDIGTRHDLGLYEALCTLVIAITFYVTGKKERSPGFFLALWCLMYAPVRFGLDFLRNTDLARADVRWAGLTPAQWGCMLMFAVGVAGAVKLRRVAVAAGS